MQTQILPYCVNTKSYRSGIDILNANDKKANIILTYRDVNGKIIKVDQLEIKSWGHKTFIPKIDGRFTIIIEGPENIIATRILSSNTKGISEGYGK